MSNASVVSHRQVLQSAAGYYVGRSCWDKELLGWFPFARESDYFANSSEATKYLDWANSDGYGQCQPELEWELLSTMPIDDVFESGQFEGAERNNWRLYSPNLCKSFERADDRAAIQAFLRGLHWEDECVQFERCHDGWVYVTTFNI